MGAPFAQLLRILGLHQIPRHYNSWTASGYANIQSALEIKTPAGFTRGITPLPEIRSAFVVGLAGLGWRVWNQDSSDFVRSIWMPGLLFVLSLALVNILISQRENNPVFKC